MAKTVRKAAARAGASTAIPASSLVADPGQPAPAGVIASVSAQDQSGKGLDREPLAENGVASPNPGTVASVSEPHSAVAPPKSELEEGGDDAALFQDLGDRYPLAAAAFEAWRGDNLPSGVRISALRDGFRRAGIAHTKLPVDHTLESLGPWEVAVGKLEQLLAETHLKVELI